MGAGFSGVSKAVLCFGHTVDAVDAGQLLGYTTSRVDVPACNCTLSVVARSGSSRLAGACLHVMQFFYWCLLMFRVLTPGARALLLEGDSCFEHGSLHP